MTPGNAPRLEKRAPASPQIQRVIQTRLSYSPYIPTDHAAESSDCAGVACHLINKVGSSLMSFLMGTPSMSQSFNSLKVQRPGVVAG